jgi:ABC-type molybdate transport system ATPase subunit
MSNIITPAQVENRLVQLSREYDEAHEALEQSEIGYANAKSLWEITSARTRLSIQAKALDSGKRITVQERDDEAVVRCQDELMAVNMSEAKVRAARANANRLRTQIDIARSVGTSVRAAMDLA